MIFLVKKLGFIYIWILFVDLMLDKQKQFLLKTGMTYFLITPEL